MYFARKQGDRYRPPPPLGDENDKGQRQDGLPSALASPAYEASPDVYQLIAENEHFRVMLATWKPGQSDDWHTHAGDLTNYALTPCKNRVEFPDGRIEEFNREEGEAGFNPIGTAHRVTNIGSDECVLLIIERK
jgi:quercetin dioxygenase-like cupin family protein